MTNPITNSGPATDVDVYDDPLGQIVDDETLVLRDGETGTPLWRGNAGGECRGECGGQGDGTNADGIPGQGDRDRLRDGSCLTP